LGLSLFIEVFLLAQILKLGIYIRNNHYYFKKEIECKVYYKALKLKKGQESLLASRLKQVEEEVLSKHFNLPYNSQKQINFYDYAKKYIESKKYKKSWDRDKQRLSIIMNRWEERRVLTSAQTGQQARSMTE